MLVPTRWLRTYCDPPLETVALAARLTLTGTKDERTYHHGAKTPDHFVVGVVRDVQPHPNADRLRVCIVDVGETDPVTIVCGAPNVAAGQSVAVALPGAELADGRTLTVAKLRGVESNGMILSEQELALGADHILFGTDYPFESMEVACRFLETAPISEIDREKISFRNAERVLNLGEER